MLCPHQWHTKNSAFSMLRLLPLDLIPTTDVPSNVKSLLKYTCQLSHYIYTLIGAFPLYINSRYSLLHFRQLHSSQAYIKSVFVIINTKVPGDRLQVHWALFKISS